MASTHFATSRRMGIHDPLQQIRPGGPPKLRITGIELPQRSFRTAEQVEETGRRLAIYCERFKVPFVYNAIVTKNWEMIKIGDLKLQRNEFQCNVT